MGAILEAVIPVVVAALGAAFSAVVATFGRRSAKAAGLAVATSVTPTLADRIESLSATLGQSRSLIDEITAEIDLQSTALERIRAEAEENKRLAALTKDEAEAVRKVVAAAIEQGQTKNARKGQRSQWLFFLAGILASVPLGVLGNYLYVLITK